MVPPALSESGFYSRYFLVPKKDGGLRPILDFRRLNHCPHETAVQDDHAEADPLADSHRGLVLFSGPERRILSHSDSPPSQTILEIRLRGSGLPVHGPTLWAVSGPPYFYEVHGRGSFPSETDGNPHSQLPRRLAHSGPVRGGTTFTQNPHPQPLRAPGAQGQFRQKRTVSQPTSIVPGYSSGLSSHERGDSARTRSGHSETRGHLQEWHRSPTQSVSENAGPYGRSIASVTAGPAPHAPPSTLVESTGSTQRMASRTLAYQGESGLCNSPDPLEEPTVDEEGRGHGVGPHQESCHDRRLQHRLGGAVRRQTDLRPLIEGEERLPHQLLPHHPQVVQKIWKTFGKAEVDLFASKDNSHCPTYYSKDRDALAHDWPNLLLYAFPPIALLPQVVRRIREQGHKVLLVAPLWRNQPWLSELTQLLTAAPWPVPLRRDILSQANGTIWHPRPELWALYIWPLNGSLLASQSDY